MGFKYVFSTEQRNKGLQCTYNMSLVGNEAGLKKLSIKQRNQGLQRETWARSAMRLVSVPSEPGRATNLVGVQCEFGRHQDWSACQASLVENNRESDLTAARSKESKGRNGKA